MPTLAALCSFLSSELILSAHILMSALPPGTVLLLICRAIRSVCCPGPAVNVRLLRHGHSTWQSVHSCCSSADECPLSNYTGRLAALYHGRAARWYLRHGSGTQWLCQ